LLVGSIQSKLPRFVETRIVALMERRAVERAETR